jgi:hypothetical protein
MRKEAIATSESGASTTNCVIAPHLDVSTTLGLGQFHVTRSSGFATFVDLRLVAESLATLLDLVQFSRRGDRLGLVYGLLVLRVVLLADAPCRLKSRVNGRTLLRLARIAEVRPNFVDASTLAGNAAHLASDSESDSYESHGFFLLGVFVGDGG